MKSSAVSEKLTVGVRKSESVVEIERKTLVGD